MKRVVLTVLLVALVVFALAVTMADFHAASVENNTSNTFSRSSSHQSGVAPAADPTRVFMHVEKRSGVASALAWELRQALQKTGGFNVVQLGSKPGPDDFPLLVTGLMEDNTFWTPFYSSGSLQIVAKYASYTSDISLSDNPSVVFDGSPEQGSLPIQMKLEIAVECRAVGLISLPAHRRILVQDAAKAIAEYLHKGIEEIQAEAARPVVEG